jgi:hypothetical protein
LVGAAIAHHDTGHALELMVDRPWNGLRQYVEHLYPNVPLSFRVTGRFRFVSGLVPGSSIALRGKPGGQIGLFLQDAARNSFALTCAHVLDATPNASSPPPVFSGSTQIGVLKHAVPLSIAPQTHANSADPGDPNSVDCALAQLSAPIANTLPNGSRLSARVGRCRAGEKVTLLASRAGLIRTTAADIKIFNDRRRTFLFFDDLILAGDDSGEPLAVEGDSGSLVLDKDGLAAGLVIAKSEGSLATTNRPSQQFKATAVICDLQKILDALRPLAGHLEIIPPAH